MATIPMTDNQRAPRRGWWPGRAVAVHLAAVGALLALAVAGCGSDTAVAGEQYCDVVAEVGDDLPTDEQFDRILALAPDEIVTNLTVVVDAIRADGEAAFSSAEVVENFPAIEAYEAENCGTTVAAEDPPPNPDATRIDVRASEYAFAFEDPPVGAVSFVIANDGQEVHEMALARLVGETTVEDAMATEDPVAEGLIEEIGFAGPIAPGDEAVLDAAELTPGRYAAVCFIQTDDGQPHAALGMVSEFTID